MSLVTWYGKLLLSPGGHLTLGPAAEVCCCPGGTPPDRCLSLTGNLTLTIDAPGCDFDGQAITLVDRSLGLGDDWWTPLEVWLSDCLSALFYLRCDVTTDIYLLTVQQQSGSTPCEIVSGTDFEPAVQTLDPFHLEFGNTAIDQGDCDCCTSFPTTLTFTIEPA